MNWKEEAIEKLRRLPIMAGAVQAIPAELERLELEAKSLQAGSGRGRGRPSLRSQENRLLDNLVRRQELERQQANAESWVGITEQALRRVNEQEETLVKMLYVEEMDAARVCDVLQMERSSMYRHRDTALKKLTLALYGALES